MEYGANCFTPTILIIRGVYRAQVPADGTERGKWWDQHRNLSHLLNTKNIDRIREWFRNYKTPDGEFALLAQDDFR